MNGCELNGFSVKLELRLKRKNARYDLFLQILIKYIVRRTQAVNYYYIHSNKNSKGEICLKKRIHCK